jgi:hypothetical protein
MAVAQTLQDRLLVRVTLDIILKLIVSHVQVMNDNVIILKIFFKMFHLALLFLIL